jgi:hypothetical protein
MIGVFPADRDNMGGKVRRWVPARSQRVGHNPGPLARGNLEKIVAEILNNGVGVSSIRQRDQTAGERHISARGFDTHSARHRQDKGKKKP